jgi:hypothetical protein
MAAEALGRKLLGEVETGTLEEVGRVWFYFLSFLV